MTGTGRSFIFAGGGSGGHLYPGLAVAERVHEIDPGAQTRFVCSDRPIDVRLLTGEGVDFTPIPARPFSIRPMAALRLARNWGRCIRQVRGIIREARRTSDEVTLVAMGGFAAAPAARAARAERAPVHLVNLDAVPGKANRWLARIADVAWTATDGAEVPSDWRRIRPIVRRGALPSEPEGTCRERFGLDPSVPVLLITGGSQGASTINRTVMAWLKLDGDVLDGWQVLHQAGDSDQDALRDSYERAGVRAAVVPYCDDMASAWGAAAAAIGRAGAGTVAEAWGSRTPMLFFPYPWHRDEHQRANAAPLVSCGGALIERDTTDPAQTAEDTIDAFRRLLDANVRVEMVRSLEGLGPVDGADVLARSLLNCP